MPSRVKRAFAWPMRRVVDSRFADVNRRVGDTRVALSSDLVALRGQIGDLTGEVGAYANTSAESLTYAGTEIRNLVNALENALDETAAARREFADARQFVKDEIGSARDQLAQTISTGFASLQGFADVAVRQRLDHVASGTLADLDGVVANLLNHAEGHSGPAAQAGVWFNPPVTVEYGEQSARVAGVNERIVELPYAMAALGRLAPGARILDIGSAESWFPLAAASLGFDVTALDLRELPYSHPQLRSISSPFEQWQPDEPGRFDAIFLISTIEHIGIGAYGEAAGATDADLGAVARVRELLVPGGLLVLTTPYGRRAVNALERIYDDEALADLLDGWEILDRRTAYRQDAVTWAPGPVATHGVVMVTATPSSQPTAPQP